jgi:hypothetical protein
MATVEELSKQRATLKGQITKISNYINLRALIENDVTIVDKKEEDLDGIFEKFEEIQKKMEPLKKESNEASIDTKDQEFETHFWDVKNAISTVRHKIVHGDPIHQNQSGNSTNDLIKSLIEALNAIQHNQQEARVRIRLPLLTLPTFNGEVGESWTTFYEIFETTIHNEARYEDIEKFSYLCSCLGDELKREVVSKFKLSGENYDSALKYLKDKYSKKKPTTAKHLSELFKAKPLLKEDYKELHNLLTCFDANIEQTKRINPDASLFDILVIFMVSSRLDDNTKRAWELHTKNEENPTWNQMREFLEGRVSLLETIQYEKECAASSSDQKSKPIVHPVKPNQSSSSNPDKTIMMSARTVHITCRLCGCIHKTHECPDLLKENVQNRNSIIKNARLCFNCLGNHKKADCRNKFSCRECFKEGKPNQKHHSILHIKKSNKATNSHQSTAQNTVEFDHKSADQVLLLTADIEIQDLSGQFQSCRALLDSGSQSCYMTENLAKKLKLPNKEVSVNVSGLGERSITVKQQVNATIKSKSKQFFEDLDFLVVPKIAEKIPRRKIDLSNVRLPKNLCLADPNFMVPHEVDILIGNEYFLSLIEEGKINLDGQGSLHLRSSVFGWLVAGKINSYENSLKVEPFKAGNMFTKSNGI